MRIFRIISVFVLLLAGLFSADVYAQGASIAAKTTASAAAKSSVRVATTKVIKESAERMTKESIEKAAKEAGERVFRETGDAAARDATERAVREGLEKSLKESAVSSGKEFVSERLGREVVESGMERAAREGAGEVSERAGKESLRKEMSDFEVSSSRPATSNEKYQRARYLDEHPELHSNLSDEDMDLLQKYRSSRYSADNSIKNVPRTGGNWSGVRGDSKWSPDRNTVPKKYNPNNKTWGQILDENGIDGIDYLDGEADLTKISVLQTTIDFDTELSAKAKDGLLSPKKNRQHLHMEVFEKMAKENGCSVDMIRVMKGDSEPVERLMKQINCSEQEVWDMCKNPGRVQRVIHECPDCKTVLLVSKEVHDNINHSGGVDMFRAFNGL